MPATLAFSYIRFSSDRQPAGACLERQLKAAGDCAVTHGLPLDTSTYRGLGFSAFKGKNVGASARRAGMTLIPASHWSKWPLRLPRRTGGDTLFGAARRRGL